jgi:hypothetical protein
MAATESNEAEKLIAVGSTKQEGVLQDSRRSAMS